MIHDRDPDSKQIDDPARDWAPDIDPDFAAMVPDWHHTPAGAPYVTTEAAERVQADLLFAAGRIGGAA